MAIADVIKFVLASVFLGLMAYNMYILNQVGVSPDLKEETNNALRTISFINGGLILLLMFISFMYVRANPATERTYVFLMLHVNLFFALLAVSVAVLSKRQ